MESKKVLKSQSGFTLIEIIAVLVVLGILAAVATPRFINLQDEAREKALEGAVAAAQSQVSMQFAENLLIEDGDAAEAWETLPEAICDDVVLTGWIEGADWEECQLGTDNDEYEIEVSYEGRSADGNIERLD